MLTFKQYIEESKRNKFFEEKFGEELEEAKYSGKKLHMFIVEDGDKIEAVYVDEKEEKSALTKIKEWMKKKSRKGDLTYIGAENPRKDGIII